jgi:F-type H+-transporting ATPase subunit b
MAETINTGVEQVGSHKKTFPPLDQTTFVPQLIWLAITFGLLYLLMRRIFLPRVDAVLNERSGHLKAEFALAERLKSDIDGASAKYQLALSEARAKANVMAKEMRDRLAAESEGERKKVEAQITAMISEAEGLISATKTKALASVDEIAGDVARAIVSRLIDKNVTTDEVKEALMRRAAE